jgi:transglutaminase-like putative cysteine protease
VQPSGDGLVRRRRTGELEGLEVKAPSSTIVDRKGSEFDMVALLTAMMRRAGLPARTVIALDLGTEDDKFLGKSSEGRRIRAWVEFALFDEARNTINWVPVDIYALRRASPRPGKIEQPWKGFGKGDDFARLAPFALHFHPPTDVAAYGSAGFWGWFVTPQTPKLAEQTISFSTGGVARRTGDVLKPITPDAKPQAKPTKEGEGAPRGPAKDDK